LFYKLLKSYTKGILLKAIVHLLILLYYNKFTSSLFYFLFIH